MSTSTGHEWFAKFVAVSGPNAAQVTKGPRDVHGRTDGFSTDDYPAFSDFLRCRVCQHLLVRLDEIFSSP